MRILLIIAFFMIFGTIIGIVPDPTQVVEAEEIHGFYGLDGLFKDPNSVVKLYKSGGFSLKNYDLGIAIFAHPVSKTEMVKFTVIDWGDERSNKTKVSRFLVGIEPLTDEITSVPTPSATPTRIEPKSSIGSDITKYDIPTISRDDGKSEFYLVFKPRTTFDSFTLGDKFELDAVVINGVNNTRVAGADISLEITRDGYIYKKISGKTSSGGTIHMEIGEMIYPLFYPNFCYDVIVTVEYGNYTHVWDDDFTVRAVGNWNPDMSWLDLDRWNYLPDHFRDEDRTEVYADSHCN